MNEEKLQSIEAKPIVVSRLESGEPKKTIFLIPLSPERASLVIPRNVKVKPAPAQGERRKKRGLGGQFWEGAMTDGAFSITPGTYLAKDSETGEMAVVRFNSNSGSKGFSKAA
jgi:hypothetical protein